MTGVIVSVVHAVIVCAGVAVTLWTTRARRGGPRVEDLRPGSGMEPEEQRHLLALADFERRLQGRR